MEKGEDETKGETPSQDTRTSIFSWALFLFFPPFLLLLLRYVYPIPATRPFMVANKNDS